MIIMEWILISVWPLKSVFPELTLTELPFEHPIYHQKFPF
jgi:hypothetical protein